MRQLLDVYEYFGASVLALMEVPVRTSRHTVSLMRNPSPTTAAATVSFASATWSRSRKRSDAPSNLAIIGRYVLTPEIFPSIEAVQPGSGGEIQLTDGLRHLLRNRPIYGSEVRWHALRRR